MCVQKAKVSVLPAVLCPWIAHSVHLEALYQGQNPDSKGLHSRVVSVYATYRPNKTEGLVKSGFLL